jgi:nucleoside-diphosphate-sugar epimerase
MISDMAATRVKEIIMKIVVIGGTGRIGSKLVNRLREHEHEAVPTSPNTGANTITGEELAEGRVTAKYRSIHTTR